MNKRWFVAGALGLLLAVFVLQAQARRRSDYLHPTLIGYVEQTSWFDRGIKVIIFEDGHGYAFQHHIPQNTAQDRGITIVRLQLAQDELDTLVQAFSRNGFLRSYNKWAGYHTSCVRCFAWQRGRARVSPPRPVLAP